MPVLALGRAEADLLAAGTASRLSQELRPDDAVVVISARAPCKDAAMLVDNVRMMECVCQALAPASVSHVVYISSDAVYRDSRAPLTEESCAEPNSLHGAMHLAREVMLKSALTAPLAILRPTLLYGAADPHNGYGPNRFGGSPPPDRTSFCSAKARSSATTCSSMTWQRSSDGC